MVYPRIRLSAVRENARLSQRELALKMQVSRATIINWESYRTKMSEADLQMYASICGFPKEYIFLPYWFAKCKPIISDAMNKRVRTMLIRTEFGNFGCPEDLLRYMQEEKIESCTVRSEYWGAKLTPMKFTQKEVMEWIRLKEG